MHQLVFHIIVFLNIIYPNKHLHDIIIHSLVELVLSNMEILNHKPQHSNSNLSPSESARQNIALLFILVPIKTSPPIRIPGICDNAAERTHQELNTRKYG